MFIHARIRYSIFLIISLILLILLPAVSFAVSGVDDDRIFKENSKDIEALKQAIRINPDDAYTHLNLGVAYGSSGMYKEAIEAYKQAIRITPDDALAHFKLSEAYLKHGAGLFINQPFQSGPTSASVGNVYISKDSRVYHHDRNCANLRTTDNLMEFASPQDAKNAGGTHVIIATYQ